MTKADDNFKKAMDSSNDISETLKSQLLWKIDELEELRESLETIIRNINRSIRGE